MKITNLLSTMLIVAFVAVSFYACESADDVAADEAVASVEVSEAIILEEQVQEEEVVIAEVEDEVDAQIEEELLSISFFKSLGEKKCPEVSFVPEDKSFPRTITKDFGEGCNLKLGNKKTGKMFIELTDRWKALNSQRIITFEDFYVNGNKIEGERVITYLNTNEAGNMVFKVEGTTTITKADGKVVSRTYDRVREKIVIEHGEGSTTIQYLITGVTTGITANGKPFTTTIIDPILRSTQCKWAITGSKKIEFENHTVVIDFNEGQTDGECDPLILRTIDDKEPEVVNLNKRKKD